MFPSRILEMKMELERASMATRDMCSKFCMKKMEKQEKNATSEQWGAKKQSSEDPMLTDGRCAKVSYN